MNRNGATLPELLVLLSLSAILGGMSLSVSADTRAALAVRAARDAAATEFARARALAQTHGSAHLQILPDGQFRIAAPAAATDAAITGTAIGARFDVTIEVDGSNEFEFDALGLGRLVSRTITFRRNDAQARLTLSSYGRPRRW